MRATIILAVLLAGCSDGDPTAEDYAKAKAYCERYGMEVYISPSFAPFQMHARLRCAVPGAFGGFVRVPPTGKEPT